MWWGLYGILTFAMAQITVTHQRTQEPCTGNLVLNMRFSKPPRALKSTNRARTSLPFSATPWWLRGYPRTLASAFIRGKYRSVERCGLGDSLRVCSSCHDAFLARLGTLGGELVIIRCTRTRRTATLGRQKCMRVELRACHDLCMCTAHLPERAE